MKKSFWIAVVVVAVVGHFAYHYGWKSSVPPTSATIQVGKMTCESCVHKIEKAVHRMSGVKDAQVNLASGNVQVTYDPSKLTQVEVIEVINHLGYEASIDQEKGQLQVIDYQVQYQ